MNLTKISPERIRELLHHSLSYDVRGPADDDKEIDTTDDVDLLLSELLALRKMAEDIAQGVEEDVFEGALEAVAAYRIEYPKEGK